LVLERDEDKNERFIIPLVESRQASGFINKQSTSLLIRFSLYLEASISTKSFFSKSQRISQTQSRFCLSANYHQPG